MNHSQKDKYKTKNNAFHCVSKPKKDSSTFVFWRKKQMSEVAGMATVQMCNMA